MWKAFQVILRGLLLTGIVIPSYAIDFNENALKHIPDRFIVVLKNVVKPDEFLKKHDVKKIKQYKHALNGLAVKGPLCRLEMHHN